MSISIVIRAFNEEENIGRLLFGISQQTIKDVEIILVDSGSTDGTLSIASQYPVNVVNITPQEFTFGRSLNKGIAAATGDIIVIISAHCFPIFPDWLEQLVKPFEEKAIALSYGKQRGGETNYYSEHRFFNKYFPDHSVYRQGHPYSHNANAAIRRELWVQHPYDETLTGLEDLAWSSWAMEAGYSIAYVAEAEVIHLHNETKQQVYKRYQREAIALKQILPDSGFSLIDFLKKWIGMTLADLNQARREDQFFKQLWPIVWFRFLQYWGTFKGFHYAGKVNAQLHKAFYYPPGILDKKVPEVRPIEPICYKEDKS